MNSFALKPLPTWAEDTALQRCNRSADSGVGVKAGPEHFRPGHLTTSHQHQSEKPVWHDATLPTAGRPSSLANANPSKFQFTLSQHMEAMGVGRPVVASQIGGLQFTVIDGLTGLLCPPGDDVALADTLATLLGNSELRERLGREGRKQFEEHYTWNVIIPRHYEPLFGPPKGGWARLPVARTANKCALSTEPIQQHSDNHRD